MAAASDALTASTGHRGCWPNEAIASTTISTAMRSAAGPATASINGPDERNVLVVIRQTSVAASAVENVAPRPDARARPGEGGPGWRVGRDPSATDSVAERPSRFVSRTPLLAAGSAVLTPGLPMCS